MSKKLNLNEQRIRDTFARLLKVEMIENQITIRQLAAVSGVSVASLVCYRNASRDCPIVKVYALAKAMGIPVRNLIPDL
jgi:hypothetical protein